MDADFRIEFIFAPLAVEPLEFNMSLSCLSESRMLTIATLLLCAAALLASWIPAARAPRASILWSARSRSGRRGCHTLVQLKVISLLFLPCPLATTTAKRVANRAGHLVSGFNCALERNNESGPSGTLHVT